MTPGGVISIVAAGLPPGARGEAVLLSTPRLLGSFTVGADGVLSAQFMVPADVDLGAHTVVLAVDGVTTSLGVQAVAASTAALQAGLLLTTGAGVDLLAVLVLLVALGGLLTLLMQPRRTIRPQA